MFHRWKRVAIIVSLIAVIVLVTQVVQAKQQQAKDKIWSLHDITSLTQVKNDLDEVAVRICMQNGAPDRFAYLTASLAAHKAQITRLKPYFFDSTEDRFDIQNRSWQVETFNNDLDILVLWLYGASDDSKIAISAGQESISLSLHDLIQQHVIERELSGTKLTFSFLLHQEIGQVEPADYGISAASEDLDLFTTLLSPKVSKGLMNAIRHRPLP
jgi:hypothetical protein